MEMTVCHGRKVDKAHRDWMIEQCLAAVRRGEDYQFMITGNRIICAYRCGDEILAFDAILRREGRGGEMKEQMKAMLAADEQRIRADERARCAGMLKFRGFCQAASMVRSDLRGDVPDPIAGESALLEACESVDRLVEIIHAKSSLASRRGGSFGIAVDESPLGREWQALDSEERAIRLSIRAAIRAAKVER